MDEQLIRAKFLFSRVHDKKLTTFFDRESGSKAGYVSFSNRKILSCVESSSFPWHAGHVHLIFFQYSGLKYKIDILLKIKLYEFYGLATIFWGNTSFHAAVVDLHHIFF